jgi:hypothetical protein
MKSSRAKGIGIALLALLFVSAALVAQDVPLNNWTVPPYHRQSASGGLQTMTDITSGSAFVGIQPCRVVDTRGGGVFVGAYGPPNLVANTPRNFDINSAAHCPGIPSAAEAYSLNFTVLTPNAPGDLRAWPQDNPPAQVTSVVNFVAGQIIANATVIPAGTGGGITVTMAGASGGVLIDINGYFTTSYNDGVSFVASGNVGAFLFPGFLVAGANSNAGGFAWGVFGLTSGAGSDSAGVGGWATNTAGKTYGVTGVTSSTATGAAGVYGANHAAVATNTLFASAGVFGIAGAGAGGAAAAGVEGLGIDRGVTGYQCTSNTLASCGDGGVVGYSPTVGLHSFGDITGAMKSFIEPHPTDASKEIKYVSLEGPEAGTYFRGKGRFQNGIAVIEVPEYFRLATDPEGLSIQVTPIGQMATVAVESIGLDRIVVRGSRNVEFFYLVNGVRPDYKDFVPIIENTDFRPLSEEDTLAEWRRPQVRKRLVANGTLTPDGKVNMETVRRLGWDKVWAERQTLAEQSRTEFERARAAGQIPSQQTP